MTRIQSSRDIFERLQENRRGFVRQHWLLLTLMILAALGDMGSTMYFMHTEGPEAEGHPVVRLVSIVLGPILGPVAGKLCQLAAAILVTIYLRRWAAVILATVTILYAWATWYNLWGCHLYYPRLLELLDRLPI